MSINNFFFMTPAELIWAHAVLPHGMHTEKLILNLVSSIKTCNISQLEKFISDYFKIESNMIWYNVHISLIC